MFSIHEILVILMSYIIGSISFAVVVSKLMKLPDPHTYGSKNPGATNVLRTGNKTAAILTLLGDALKGYLAFTLAKIIFGIDAQSYVLPVVAVATFLGHLYPIYHRFKGGKGVATALGLLFAIDWILGVACLSTWLIIVFFFRYSSLAAIVSAIFAPFYFFLLFGFQKMLSMLVLISVSLIWNHRANIMKLINGQESKITSN